MIIHVKPYKGIYKNLRYSVLSEAEIRHKKRPMETPQAFLSLKTIMKNFNCSTRFIYKNQIKPISI